MRTYKVSKISLNTGSEETVEVIKANSTAEVLERTLELSKSLSEEELKDTRYIVHLLEKVSVDSCEATLVLVTDILESHEHYEVYVKNLTGN